MNLDTIKKRAREEKTKPKEQRRPITIQQTAMFPEATELRRPTAVEQAAMFPGAYIKPAPPDPIQELRRRIDILGRATQRAERVRRDVGRRALDFGVAVARDFPRSVAQLTLKAAGEEKVIPYTRAERFLFGEAPIYTPEETGRQFLRAVGVGEKRAGELGGIAGYPLAILGAIPIVGFKKGAKEKLAKDLAKTGTKAGTKTLLKQNIKGIDEKSLDDLAEQLTPIKDPKVIQQRLDDFVKKQRPIEKVKPAIPKELEPLAREARKYKSAEEFIKDVNKSVKQHEELFSITAQEKRRITTGSSELKRALTPEEKRLQKVYDTFYRKLKPEERVYKDFYNQAVREVKPEIPIKKLPIKPPAEIPPIKEEIPSRLPAVIQGETFTLGIGEMVGPDIKGLRAAHKAEIRATKKELKNAEIARVKATKLEARQQKIRQEAIGNINRFYGNTDNIKTNLKARHLSDEDIANIILEDGTRLVDTLKVKRTADKTLSAVIKKSEIEDIARNYTDKIPEQKWVKRSMLVEGVEVPIKTLRSIELPSVYFERKGLSALYEPIIKSGRDAEQMKTMFLKRFEDAGLFKRDGWFTAERFNISKDEAEGIARYYLGRQGRGKKVALKELSEESRKFIGIFDGIIKETEERFFELAKKMGKTPGMVENYAPIMTSKDLKQIDEIGSMDWLFRNHPAFFSLKERAKKVPFEVYELDYRQVASRWLDGITDFLNYSEETNRLKYLVNSDQFKNIVKASDQQFISNWLRDITTAELPTTVIRQAFNPLSRLLRRTVAMGALGLNYATVIKQGLSAIPLTIIEKAPLKLKSKYAKAFGINVADLPAITKRRGDIAIQDMRGQLNAIFMGPLKKADRAVAQRALNGLLDKEYGKFLKEGVEITPKVRAVIETRAQNTLDMWMGGFFKGQRPEAFRKELGNFILMFTYPITSQLNGFYRHILKAQGVEKYKAGAEILAAAIAIAYIERSIERLSPQWSHEEGMTRDVLLSLTGNIPVVGDIAFSIANQKEMQISPVMGNLNNIIRNIGENEWGKVGWGAAETAGLPRQFRRIKEGMDIMEAGGITDKEGRMLAPVQDTIELVRSFLRGKYGSIAARDWVSNIGEKREDRRWFVPQVEFLQNGDYDRKAELYLQFGLEERMELRRFLSENQQNKLNKALERRGETGEVLSNQKARDVWMYLSEMTKIDQDQANKVFREIKKVNPQLADELRDIKEKEEASLVYSIWQQLERLETREEKNALIRNLRKQGIITDKIFERLREMRDERIP